MPEVSEGELCQAVLDFVTEGSYPEENVVAAELPATALAKELELIAKAREEVENELSSLSREDSFDADDWIVQAKQLHADIERSRATAREIVAQHEHTRPLQAKVEDASAKVALIETEIVFNQTVTETLEEVQRLSQQLASGRAAVGDGQITTAIELLESADKAIGRDTFFSNTNVMSILSIEVAQFRKEIEEALRLRWTEQLKVNHQDASFQISLGEGVNSLDSTIASLSRLDLLTTTNDQFQRDFLSVIVDPILLPHKDRTCHGVTITEGGIWVDSQSSPAAIAQTLDRITSVLDFLRERLPTSISASLSQFFIPAVAAKAIAGSLSSEIPTDLNGLDEFEKTLDRVMQFTNTVNSWGWSGHEELVSWVNQAPRTWLARRRIHSLDSVRKVLAASQGATKQVERVEKEKVSQADGALLENATNDDWDAGWDDEKDEATADKMSTNQPQGEEEDFDAWGLDEDAQEASKDEGNEKEEDDADDAWGWGDDDQGETGDRGRAVQTPSESKQANGGKAAQVPSPKEVVLREMYTVTDIPDSVLGVIQQQIADSKDITKPPHSNSRIASSGAGLLALPTLILAMFKATSSSFYSLKLSSGQMYLYNDSLYLASQVRELCEEHELSRLSSDVDALEKFGKFAYSKEMQTQSTIVTDLLDGAQGFAQCAEQPFKTECENAVSAAVDRIRDVHKEWQPILSHSALLQSTGSLLSTVISKIIIDVEDLGDISEDQSKQLVSLCNQVSKLEDLFMPETTADAEAMPVTAVYVPSWLRFQYLINILESSLADIKFLWLDGELGLEFSVDEVVDLIEALFAESDYRRRAISEICRAPRG